MRRPLGRYADDVRVLVLLLVASCTAPIEPFRYPKSQSWTIADCDAGKGVACYAIGWEAQERDEHAQARAWWVRGCDAGYGDACAAIGDYERACQLGVSCLAAADSFVRSHSVAGPQARLTFLLDRCERDDRESCGELSRAYEQTPGVSADESRTRAVFHRECKRRDRFACADLGTMYAAMGDAANTEASWQQACELGHAVSCYELVVDELGKLRSDDHEVAAPLLERSCELDPKATSACVIAGTMYQNADGVPALEARAVELYVRACDGAEPGGCAQLAHMYRYGIAVRMNVKHAIELDRTACTAGDALACRDLAAMCADDGPC